MNEAATAKQVQATLSSASSFQAAVSTLRGISGETLPSSAEEYTVGDLINGLFALQKLAERGVSPSDGEVQQTAGYITQKNGLRSEALALYEQVSQE